GLGILSSPVSAAVDVVSSLSAGVSGGTLQLNSVPTGATLTLSRSGDNARLTDPTNVLNAGLGVLSIDSHTIEVPLVSLTNGIMINGGSGPEIVNVDFSGGTPIPLGGLTLSGGAGTGDVLNLDNVPAVGVGGFSSTVHTFSSSDTGSVTLDADGNPA